MDKEDVVYIYNGMLLSHKKEWSLSICSNMEGPRGYYTQWNMSNREGQIPYDFSYMWNLKIKIKKQAKQKQTHKYREHFEGYQMWGTWGMGKKRDGLRCTNGQL